MRIGVPAPARAGTTSKARCLAGRRARGCPPSHGTSEETRGGLTRARRAGPRGRSAASAGDNIARAPLSTASGYTGEPGGKGFPDHPGVGVEAPAPRRILHGGRRWACGGQAAASARKRRPGIFSLEAFIVGARGARHPCQTRCLERGEPRRRSRGPRSAGGRRGVRPHAPDQVFPAASRPGHKKDEASGRLTSRSTAAPLPNSARSRRALTRAPGRFPGRRAATRRARSPMPPRRGRSPRCRYVTMLDRRGGVPENQSR